MKLCESVGPINYTYSVLCMLQTRGQNRNQLEFENVLVLLCFYQLLDGIKC